MLGKTHFAVGIAATVAVTQPKTVPDLILAVGAGSLGALISDIDVETSGSHKDLNKITMLSMIAVLGILSADHVFHTGIAERMISNSSFGRIVIGLLFLLSICAFGKEQPHRSFMHSFLAGILLCLAVGMIWEKAVPYFAVGFLSHLAIDLFNKKKVRLFYPMKAGISLGVFRSDGWMNSLLFVAASIVAAAEVFVFMARMFGLASFITG